MGLTLHHIKTPDWSFTIVVCLWQHSRLFGFLFRLLRPQEEDLTSSPSIGGYAVGFGRYKNDVDGGGRGHQNNSFNSNTTSNRSIFRQHSRYHSFQQQPLKNTFSNQRHKTCEHSKHSRAIDTSDYCLAHSSGFCRASSNSF